MHLRAACIQLQGSSDLERNLSVSEAAIREAAAQGATLIATPEATDYLGPHKAKADIAEALDGPRALRWSSLARELQITLLVGSVAERCTQGPPANTSLLFSPSGALQAHYRKLHLFDVDVPGGVRFSESRTTTPGDRIVSAPIPGSHLGLSICYDLRFPPLYQALRDQGAEILAVPSAFTARTGEAHWEVLLRARAIETQCFVLAPGHWGPHDDQGLRESWGHSCIIDPWGRVLAEQATGEGFCIADLDLQALRELRARMPVWEHRRLPLDGG
ncbi:MAG: carbon-nitrogen hydrolase family protein [Myxococcota bacterium]|nr:carbon-nitrogen hydrolase family protein [Myxococcota bacterium]